VAALDAAARHPHRETLDVVVAPDREARVLEMLGNDAWGVGEVVEGDGVELWGV